jgi:hypothetical protein
LQGIKPVEFSNFQATIVSVKGHGTENNYPLIHCTSSQWIKRTMSSGPVMIIKASLAVLCHKFSKAWGKTSWGFQTYLVLKISPHEKF